MKMPEQVEWLERNYDSFYVKVIDEEEFGLPGFTVWRAPAELHDEQWELGMGSGHQQPMFTLKDMGENSYVDSYHWFANTSFVPLSRESESESLHDDV